MNTIKLSYVETFASRLKRIINIASQHSKKVSSKKNIAIMAIDSMPIVTIDTVGAILTKYRTQIVEFDDNFFLNADFRQEIELAESKTETSREQIIAIINEIKLIYPNLSKDIKNTIKNYLSEMLISYDEYSNF